MINNNGFNGLPPVPPRWYWSFLVVVLEFSCGGTGVFLRWYCHRNTALPIASLRSLSSCVRSHCESFLCFILHLSYGGLACRQRERYGGALPLQLQLSINLIYPSGRERVIVANNDGDDRYGSRNEGHEQSQA